NTTHPPSTVRLPDDSYTTDAQSTADYLLDRFMPDDDPVTDDNSHLALRSWVQHDDSAEGMLAFDDVPFAHEEIADAIKKQNDAKSPGEDGISANILRVAYEHAGDVFDWLFNSCLKYHCFPTWFKSSIVKAIPKSASSDLQNPKS